MNYPIVFVSKYTGTRGILVAELVEVRDSGFAAVRFLGGQYHGEYDIVGKRYWFRLPLKPPVPMNRRRTVFASA